MENFAELIQALLNSGLTQVELAEKVGTSQGYISDLLHGRRGISIGFVLGSKLVALHAERCQQAA